MFRAPGLHNLSCKEVTGRVLLTLVHCRKLTPVRCYSGMVVRCYSVQCYSVKVLQFRSGSMVEGYRIIMAKAGSYYIWCEVSTNKNGRISSTIILLKLICLFIYFVFHYTKSGFTPQQEVKILYEVTYLPSSFCIT